MDDIFCGMYDSETSALEAFDKYNHDQNAEFEQKIDPVWKDKQLQLKQQFGSYFGEKTKKDEDEDDERIGRKKRRKTTNQDLKHKTKSKKSSKAHHQKGNHQKTYRKTKKIKDNNHGRSYKKLESKKPTSKPN